MAIQFNLLPWRQERRKKRAKNNQVTLILGALVGLLAGGGYYAWQKGVLEDHNKALAVLKERNQKLEPLLKEKKELDELKVLLNNQIDAIEALQANRASVSHMVEELSNANNQELFLKEFVLNNGAVTISGIAQDDTQISDLMKKLRASVWYQEPKLVQIISDKKLGEEVKAFTITSQLLLPGTQQKKEDGNG